MVRITIQDVGTVAQYALVGSSLRMTETGGCRDALLENGVELNETMTDDEIAVQVIRGWLQGYVGDPEQNELSLHLDRE